MMTIAKRLACVTTVVVWTGFLTLLALLNGPPFSTSTPGGDHVSWMKGLSGIVYITPLEQGLVDWTAVIGFGAGLLWLGLISLEARFKRSPEKLW